MTQPTKAQLDAACAKVRELIQNYSSFYSSMVSDYQIRTEMTIVLTVALNAEEPSA